MSITRLSTARAARVVQRNPRLMNTGQLLHGGMDDRVVDGFGISVNKLIAPTMHVHEMSGHVSIS